MPLIEKIGKVSVYGSSHMIEEVPYLDEFLGKIEPHSLYLEISPGDIPDELAPDMRLAMRYAADGNIPIRRIGYSEIDVYKKLGHRHSVATTIYVAIRMLTEFTDGMMAVQQQKHPPDGTRYAVHKALLELTKEPARFADAMRDYLLDGAMFIMSNYSVIPAEAQRKARSGLEGYLDSVRGDTEDTASSIASKTLQVPITEEDIRASIEVAKNCEMMTEAYRGMMREFMQEWLKLTNATMWKNARTTIRGDEPPIGMVIGYQHFPYITEQLRGKTGVL